jgi:sterol desaturase/sphingolipid hydroxylase (fatty acid hydroxylase superfamily)
MSTTRLSIFLILFALLLLAETLAPLRQSKIKKIKRWKVNFSMVIVFTIVKALLIPIGLVQLAALNQTPHWQWGLGHLLGITYSLPYQILLLVLFDFFIYWQHVYSHKWKWLWRFHQVHHFDPELDATSALRFHPIELLISFGFKVVLVFLFSPTAQTVFLFEVILNSLALFNHSNWRLPFHLDTPLSRLIVTPQMHLIHHHQDVQYTDTNFGFCLSIWDQLFKTRTLTNKVDILSIPIGQDDYSTNSDDTLNMLYKPFKK